MISPRLDSRDRDRQRLACGRSLLSQPRHATDLFFYSVHIGAGEKKQESHWAWQPPQLSYLECGLTGLLNPTSIWHETISVVFHKVFPSCFVQPYRMIHRSGRQMPRSSCPPLRQLGTAEMVEWACRFRKLDSCVSMVKPAKNRMRDNVSEPFDLPRVGRVLPKRNVSSHLVIIGGVFRKNSPKVLGVEYDQMVKTFASDRPDQALNISVLPRRVE